MCGRYVVEVDEPSLREIIAEAQRRLKEGELKTGEIYPTNIAPVQVMEKENMAALPMTWGFPKWDGKGVIINARAETAAEKKTFKKPLMEKRAVIPTSGFFEWKHEEGQKKKDKYLFSQPNSNTLYLAGFYNEYEGTDRFCILTTAANTSMEIYHNRMPVLLHEDERKAWLTGDILHDVITRTPFELFAAQTG